MYGKESDMLEDVKRRVCDANKSLARHGLVTLTWGNVSAAVRNGDSLSYVVIKPSGVPYDCMTTEDMVVLDIDGCVAEGKYKPSSDAPTHMCLYKEYPALGGIVHTHSAYATAFAQAGIPIAPYGTTHADYFYGTIPCTRALTNDEINGMYERETGCVIIETLRLSNTDPSAVPGALVKSHAPFAWGRTAEEAVEHAVVLEEVARMAVYTCMLNPNVNPVPGALLDKHYLRKHGANAYYGQR